MRRREFILLLGGAAAWPLAARAQQAKAAIIGLLGTGTAAAQSQWTAAFVQRMRELGWVEGRNLAIEYRWAEGRTERLAALANDLVRLKVDVVVTHNTPGPLAAKQATSTIPIVFATAGDPVGTGIVASLARPGGNITGVSLFDADFYAKRLQILKEVVPSASKVASLTMRRTWEGAYGQAFQPALQEASRRLQISLIPMLLGESTPTEYQRVFAEIAQDRPDAILVSDIGDLLNYRQLIVELVEKSHLPAMYGAREFIEVGGLMAYQADLAEVGRRMADDVHEILNGAKPGDIPIYQSGKFQYLINLKAAKALGLNIPPTLLALADEVIE